MQVLILKYFIIFKPDFFCHIYSSGSRHGVKLHKTKHVCIGGHFICIIKFHVWVLHFNLSFDSPFNLHINLTPWMHTPQYCYCPASSDPLSHANDPPASAWMPSGWAPKDPKEPKSTPSTVLQWPETWRSPRSPTSCPADASRNEVTTANRNNEDARCHQTTGLLINPIRWTSRRQENS